MAAGDKLDKDVSRIVEQRDESLRWLADFYLECTDVFKASKMRTDPIYKKKPNKSGTGGVIDKSRTNVAMPDIYTMIRRNAARLTAQPPHLQYRSSDPDLSDRLTLRRYWAFDRSGEKRVQMRHAHQAEAFGWSVTKKFYASLRDVRTFAFQRAKLGQQIPRAMKSLGYDEAEVADYIGKNFPQLSEAELSAQIAEHGPALKHTFDYHKYEGPANQFIFIGDIFPAENFDTLNTADYINQQYIENDDWLTSWKDVTYADPETGKDILVMDPKALQELLDSDKAGTGKTGWDKNQQLRQQMLTATGQKEFNPKYDLIRGKKFYILENHEKRDGWWWITWVGNEDTKLGEMPYRWDMGGRPMFTELVTIPSLLGGIGEATPRLLKFLYELHNTNVNQRTDIINAILRPMVFQTRGADVPDEAIERALMRVVQVKSPNDYRVEQTTQVPQATWEAESQTLRMMSLAEPSLTNLETGTNLNPQAGKTATTSVLQQRAIDVLFQSKLDSYDCYWKEDGEKDLAMMQGEAALGEMESISIINPRRWSRTDALVQQFGQTARITIDPYELSEDIEVEPEAASTLAVDDEFHRMNAQWLYQASMQDPVTFSRRECALLVVRTMRGADPNKVINPVMLPPPEQPKVSVGIQIKYAELDPDTQKTLIEGITKQPVGPGFQVQKAVDGVKKLAEAGEAANSLMKREGDNADTGRPTEPRRTMAG